MDDRRLELDDFQPPHARHGGKDVGRYPGAVTDHECRRWVNPRDRRCEAKHDLRVHVAAIGSVDFAEKGNAGIEQTLDDDLAGRSGEETIVSDVKQHAFASEVANEAQPGRGVRIRPRRQPDHQCALAFKRAQALLPVVRSPCSPARSAGRPAFRSSPSSRSGGAVAPSETGVARASI